MSKVSYLISEDNTDIKCEDPINMQNNKITSVATPTVSTDAVNKAYADNLVSEFINVKTFGAIGNGIADDTVSINNALIYATSQLGSNVLMPPGIYKITSTISIPKGVCLRGYSNGMRRGSFVQSLSDTPVGTMITITNTSNNAIIMGEESTIEGIEFHYPNQNGITSASPIVYPWTIEVPSNSHGCTIRDIQCNIAYRFLTVEGDGVTIHNIQGSPLKTGIFLGRVADVARLTNIQFNPNVYAGLYLSNLGNWILANGEAFVIDGAEEFKCWGCFAFNYNIGTLYGFTYPGFLYGSWSDFGFDQCNYGIYVPNASISNKGVVYSNGKIIPKLSGILFADSSATTSAIPFLELSNVSFYNGSGYDRAVWFQTNSRAKFNWISGFGQDFSSGQQMILIESSFPIIKIVAVKHVGTTRITNSGGAIIEDILGENNVNYMGRGVVSTSPTTGDLVVNSGVGIGGALNIGGGFSGGQNTSVSPVVTNGTNVTSTTLNSGYTFKNGNLIYCNLNFTVSVTDIATSSIFTFNCPLRTTNITNVFDISGNVNGYFNLSGSDYNSLYNCFAYGNSGGTSVSIKFTSNGTNTTNYLVVNLIYTV